jgi:hypothetical protein
VGADFADLPFVTTDDWETATGRVFPPAATDIRSAKNRQRAEVPWVDRTPTAFFRGNSTGLGADPGSNQRLYLAATSHTWARSKEYGPGNAVDGVPFLDAGVVGFSARDRKEQGKPMTFMKARHFAFGTADRVPMYAQMRFKYHIYMDGHCAAMRYASMMPLGAVIIKVASRTKADSMWFFPLLRPYDIHAPHPDPRGDHVPVRADLSDLGEVIQWLKTHDAEARAIVANSTALYGKLVGLEGQLDYLQLVCWEIARRFTSNAELAGGGGVAAGDGSSVSGGAAASGAVGAAADAVVRAVAVGDLSEVDRAALLAAKAAGAATLVPAFGRCPAVFSAPAASGDGGGGASSSSAGPHPPGSHVADSTAAADATVSTGDWFGPDNEDYTTCLIGRSAAPRPQVPLHMANVECECPACGVKRAARAAAAAAAVAPGLAANRGGGGTRVFSTAGAAASLGFSRGGGAASKHAAGPGAAPASASTAAPVPKPALQMNDKLRERLAAAAALAKQKEAERASAAAAAGARGRH